MKLEELKERRAEICKELEEELGKTVVLPERLRLVEERLQTEIFASMWRGVPQFIDKKLEALNAVMYEKISAIIEEFHAKAKDDK